MKGCESFDPITKQSAGFDAGLPEREEEKPVGIFMVGDPPVTRTRVAPFAQNDTSVGHRMSDGEVLLYIYRIVINGYNREICALNRFLF